MAGPKTNPDKTRRPANLPERRVPFSPPHVTPESPQHRYHSEDRDPDGWIDRRRYTRDHEDCACG